MRSYYTFSHYPLDGNITAKYFLSVFKQIGRIIILYIQRKFCNCLHNRAKFNLERWSTDEFLNSLDKQTRWELTDNPVLIKGHRP